MVILNKKANTAAELFNVSEEFSKSFFASIDNYLGLLRLGILTEGAVLQYAIEEATTSEELAFCSYSIGVILMAEQSKNKISNLLNHQLNTISKN